MSDSGEVVRAVLLRRTGSADVVFTSLVITHGGVIYG